MFHVSLNCGKSTSASKGKHYSWKGFDNSNPSWGWVVYRSGLMVSSIRVVSRGNISVINQGLNNDTNTSNNSCQEGTNSNWPKNKEEGMLKLRLFKNRELYWSNLPKFKSGVQIPVVKFLAIFLFFFTFFILSIKNWILKHTTFFVY
jgi:hypothetical protein